MNVFPFLPHCLTALDYFPLKATTNIMFRPRKTLKKAKSLQAPNILNIPHKTALSGPTKLRAT